MYDLCLKFNITLKQGLQFARHYPIKSLKSTIKIILTTTNFAMSC